MAADDEEELLRSVALQNANSILLARERAEEVVRDVAERLQLALSAGQLGDWSWDAASDSVTLGDRASTIFGQPGGQPVSLQHLRASLSADDQQRASAAFAAALAERSDYSIEYRVTRPDGKQCWVNVKGRGVYSDDGAATGMIGVIQDVTERKSTEETRFHLAAVMESSDDAIVGKDLEGVVTAWNTGAERIFGYSALEMVGKSITTIIPADRSGEETAILEQLKRGERIDHYETVRIRKDGTSLDVSLTVSPIRDASGRIVGASKIARDITQQKRADDEREQLLKSEQAARAEAERVSIMKDEFLATLSHELRTPLSAILGWSQLLASGNLEEDDVKQGLEAIERNARVQTQLIEDLLDMSRIVSGKVRLDVQWIDLASIVDMAVDSVRPSAEAKQIRLRKVIDPHAGPVSGDPTRLQQIIWNLLTNAIKFTPKGGTVDVLLERVNSHLEITVHDSGIGIKPEFLPLVFERFRQADSSTTRSYGGLGLGLSIVKNLVELHGGSVRVESAGEGHGATFVVNLPLAPIRGGGKREHPTAPKPPGPDCEQILLTGVRVLVVDDEPDARELIKRVLGQCEAEVITARNSEEGIELLRSQSPNVIVSDIGMPDRDGYQFIREVRNLPSLEGGKTPAIALTAFARSEDRTRAMLAGYQVHIAKPIEPQELIATVGSLAGRTG
ncbi:MAG: PAS domain S-box protein [Pirellulales bacterium]